MCARVVFVCVCCGGGGEREGVLASCFAVRQCLRATCARVSKCLMGSMGSCHVFSLQQRAGFAFANAYAHPNGAGAAAGDRWRGCRATA